MKLILPALIPSWNFFDVIVASPRIQYALLIEKNEPETAWCEFRPRSNKVSCTSILSRLFWNARWNETLYLVSCAERLEEDSTQHCENEIFKRIIADISHNNKSSTIRYVKFRLVFIQRKGNSLVEQIHFHSPIRLIENTDYA